jgi:hypothetical protein
MMLATELIAAMATPGCSDAVEMRFRDLTCGETEESYVFCGQSSRFDSLTDFCAASLRQLYIELEFEEGDITRLEVAAVPPAAWMVGMYDANLPKDSEKRYGPLSPRLEIRYCLNLNIGFVDECIVCTSESEYVLLYWYTTG